VGVQDYPRIIPAVSQDYPSIPVSQYPKIIPVFQYSSSTPEVLVWRVPGGCPGFPGDFRDSVWWGRLVGVQDSVFQDSGSVGFGGCPGFRPGFRQDSGSVGVQDSPGFPRIPPVPPGFRDFKFPEFSPGFFVAILIYARVEDQKLECGYGRLGSDLKRVDTADSPSFPIKTGKQVWNVPDYHDNFYVYKVSRE
jgi:hypothetical protein